MGKEASIRKYRYVFAAVLLVLAFAAGWYWGAGKTRDSAIHEIFGKTAAINIDGVVTGVAGDRKSATIDVPSYAGVRLPQEYRQKTVSLEKAELVKISRKTEAASQSAGKKNNAPITIPFTITPTDASSLMPGIRISMTFSGGALASLLSSDLAPVKITILDTR